MSVLERSLHFGPGTSVTSPLRWKGRKSGFRAFLLSLTLDTCPQSRPWECGNPKGISKECGKGGKPASWLSILSIFCHFHGLLWNACSKSEVAENPVLQAINSSSVAATGLLPAADDKPRKCSTQTAVVVRPGMPAGPLVVTGPECQPLMSVSRQMHDLVFTSISAQGRQSDRRGR